MYLPSWYNINSAALVVEDFTMSQWIRFGAAFAIYQPFSSRNRPNSSGGISCCSSSRSSSKLNINLGSGKCSKNRTLSVSNGCCYSSCCSSTFGDNSNLNLTYALSSIQRREVPLLFHSVSFSTLNKRSSSWIAPQLSGSDSCCWNPRMFPWKFRIRIWVLGGTSWRHGSLALLH